MYHSFGDCSMHLDADICRLDTLRMGGSLTASKKALCENLKVDEESMGGESPGPFFLGWSLSWSLSLPRSPPPSAFVPSSSRPERGPNGVANR